MARESNTNSGAQRKDGQHRRVDRQPASSELGSLLNRQPPYSMEAEKGVLGSMILMHSNIDDVATMLRSHDFHFEANRLLYEHLLEMRNSSKSIDVTLLLERLKDKGDLERVGGASWIGEVFSSVANTANARYYAEIVRQKSILRSVIESATETLRDAYETESDEAEKLLSMAEQRIFAIGENAALQIGKENSVRDVIMQALDRLDAKMRGDHTEGLVETHYVDLDKLLGGLRAAELIILAARPSMGKTAFAMNIAENVVRYTNSPVLFVSLEMNAIDLIERMLCSVARVDSHRLRNGSLDDGERGRLRTTASGLSRVPLYVDDSPSRTVAEIASTARRLKRRAGSLGMIVVDYLQLVEPDSSRDPRQEQVAKIARQLKGLAREINVPVLCISQLNRQADEKGHRPRMSQLRESGAIEQDADVIIFVHREEYYLNHDPEAQAEVAGQAEIIVEKHRNGPTGVVNMTWLSKFTRFEDRAPHHHEEFGGIGGNGNGMGRGEF